MPSVQAARKPREPGDVHAIDPVHRRPAETLPDEAVEAETVVCDERDAPARGVEQLCGRGELWGPLDHLAPRESSYEAEYLGRRVLCVAATR